MNGENVKSDSKRRLVRTNDYKLLDEARTDLGLKSCLSGFAYYVTTVVIQCRVWQRECNTQFTPSARPNKTVASVSRLRRRCKSDNCSERVQISNFPSATVFSSRESNSHHRRRRDEDATVLYCLAWRCELGISLFHVIR